MPIAFNPRKNSKRAGFGAKRMAKGQADQVISGLCVDSRDVRPGDLFAALPGADVHGGEFHSICIAHGSSCSSDRR